MLRKTLIAIVLSCLSITCIAQTTALTKEEMRVGQRACNKLQSHGVVSVRFAGGGVFQCASAS